MSQMDKVERSLLAKPLVRNNRLPAGEILFNTKEVGSSGFYGINCGS